MSQRPFKRQVYGAVAKAKAATRTKPVRTPLPTQNPSAPSVGSVTSLAAAVAATATSNLLSVSSSSWLVLPPAQRKRKRQRMSGSTQRRIRKERKTQLSKVSMWLQNTSLTEMPAISWEPPQKTPGEYLEKMSPQDQLKARNQLYRIQQKIADTCEGQIGGHWSRHERNLGTLRADYPTAPQIKTVSEGYKFCMTHLPTQNYVPHPRGNTTERRLRSLV